MSKEVQYFFIFRPLSQCNTTFNVFGLHLHVTQDSLTQTPIPTSYSQRQQYVVHVLVYRYMYHCVCSAKTAAFCSEN